MTLGSQAPNFTLVDDEKNEVSLSDFSGKNVLLLFFPAAFTGVCTTELNAVNNELDLYSGKDVSVLGISTDTPFVLAEFKKANSLDYPLLSDHNCLASNLYGTKYNEGEFVFGLDRISRRAAFLVDKEGLVRYSEVLESAGDQPDFDKIKTILDSL